MGVFAERRAHLDSCRDKIVALSGDLPTWIVDCNLKSVSFTDFSSLKIVPSFFALDYIDLSRTRNQNLIVDRLELDVDSIDTDRIRHIGILHRHCDLVVPYLKICAPNQTIR